MASRGGGASWKSGSVLPMMMGGHKSDTRRSASHSGDVIAVVMAGAAAGVALFMVNETVLATSLPASIAQQDKDQTQNEETDRKHSTGDSETQIHPFMASLLLATLAMMFQLLIHLAFSAYRQKVKGDDPEGTGFHQKCIHEAKFTIWQSAKRYDRIPSSFAYALTIILLIYLPHTVGIFQFMLVVGLDMFFGKLGSSRGMLLSNFKMLILTVGMLLSYLYASDAVAIPNSTEEINPTEFQPTRITSRSARIFSACTKLLRLLESSDTGAMIFKWLAVGTLGFAESRLRDVFSHLSKQEEDSPLKGHRKSSGLTLRVAICQSVVLLGFISVVYCIKTTGTFAIFTSLRFLIIAFLLACFYMFLKEKVFANITRRLGPIDLRMWFSVSGGAAGLLLSLLFEKFEISRLVIGVIPVFCFCVLQRELVKSTVSEEGLLGRWDSGRGAPTVLEGSAFADRFRRLLKHVMSDSNSRKIMYFLSINLAFMFVEIFVGLLTNSLGLVSDAGHMFFDNASLFIGLYAAYMSKWKSDEVYTYGYSRYETLAGFANGVFLVFIAVSVVIEGLERLREPPEIRSDHLLLVSFLGLLVNLVGLAFFHEHSHGHSHGGGHGHNHSGHGHSHSHDHSHPHGHSHEGDHHEHEHGHGHSHGDDHHGHGHTHTNGAHEQPHVHAEHQHSSESAHNENMHGVFLHVLADTLGSAGVICSSLLIELYEWYWADAVASLLIAILILLSVVPFLRATSTALLLKTPTHLLPHFQKALSDISRLSEVHRLEDAHCWQYDSATPIITVNVQVTKGISIEKVTRSVKNILSEDCGVENTTVQATHVT